MYHDVKASDTAHGDRNRMINIVMSTQYRPSTMSIINEITSGMRLPNEDNNVH